MSASGILQAWHVDGDTACFNKIMTYCNPNFNKKDDLSLAKAYN